MELESTYVYPLQRINDERIMAKIYLNVATITDVTLASSKKLDPHMYKGDRSLDSSVATHMKINQQKPGP
eukprot:13267723-Ditylum_brightwellii.AAC.1